MYPSVAVRSFARCTNISLYRPFHQVQDRTRCLTDVGMPLDDIQGEIANREIGNLHALTHPQPCLARISRYLLALRRPIFCHLQAAHPAAQNGNLMGYLASLAEATCPDVTHVEMLGHTSDADVLSISTSWLITRCKI